MNACIRCVAAGSPTSRAKPSASARRPGPGIGRGGDDRRLGLGDGLGRERRHPSHEAVDERGELGGAEGPVHPAPPLGGGGVDVVAPDRHLERAGPADEPWQPLRARAARQDAERHLRLPEEGVGAGEAHVERRRQLAAAAAGDALDDGDGQLRHRPEAVDHRVEEAETFLRRSGALRRQLQDQLDVGVGDEPSGHRRAQHDDRDRRVLRHLTAGGIEGEHELEIEQVDRRVVDGERRDAAFVVAHRACLHGKQRPWTSPTSTPIRFVVFRAWLDDVVAAPLPEPMAMVLATAPAGRPRATPRPPRAAAWRRRARARLGHQHRVPQGQAPGREPHAAASCSPGTRSAAR